jgi:hypothetical protein
MHKHKPSTKPQQKRSIFKTAKETLSHLTVIAVISIAGHAATALLSPAAGALGMALYPSVGGMGFMYGS